MLYKIRKWMSIITSFFKRKNGAYYIGGHESLPKPLTREEEAITIKAFMEGDMNARDRLIEKTFVLLFTLHVVLITQIHILKISLASALLDL